MSRVTSSTGWTSATPALLTRMSMWSTPNPDRVLPTISPGAVALARSARIAIAELPSSEIRETSAAALGPEEGVA